MPWPTFADLILDIRDRLSRIEGRLESNSEHFRQRLNRVEDRIEDRINRDKIRFPDYAPYLYGLVVLGLAASGRIEWASVAGMLFGK